MKVPEDLVDEIANSVELARIVLCVDAAGERLGIMATCACRWRSTLQIGSVEAINRYLDHLRGGHAA